MFFLPLFYEKHQANSFTMTNITDRKRVVNRITQSLFIGVVFYGERAVERHVKAVHPSEMRHYFLSNTRKETEAAIPTRQRCEGML